MMAPDTLMKVINMKCRAPGNVFMRLAVAMVVTFAVAGNIEARKPNIILMMADDVSWEAFGCYGGEDYLTPRIDQLAAEGIRFDHCYSTPICTPSRVKIMTGKYNFRNYTHFGYLSPNETTFGHMLQDAGYQTAIAGKWQLNGLYNKLPGHQDPMRPIKAGFHESLLWQVTEGKGGNGRGGERFWSPPLEHNGRFITKEENHGKYGPDLFTDFICNFMERNRERPFFVYFPMCLVHDPFVPTPDTLGDADLATANKQPKEYAKKKANFIAMVQYMDKLVGRITDKVDSLGLGEDTIILFTADNGTHPSITSKWKGTEITGGKGGTKDNGTHVPLVARWTGSTPVGKVEKSLVEFSDFFATFAEAAGVDYPEENLIDGYSFLSQLQGRDGVRRPWVLSHYNPYWGKQPSQSVRTANFKLYRNGNFFNVPVDLDEKQNLNKSVDPEMLKIMEKLQSIIDQCPPVPQGTNNNKTKNRPVYPGHIIDPLD